jgi:hypothetical protein
LILLFPKELAMDRQNNGVSGSQVSSQAFAARMQAATDTMLQEVMQAVNRAPDGAWINGSEMEVRDLLGEYRRRVFETALQMKIEAAEGAFSPGGLIAAGEQGNQSTQHADRKRTGEPGAAAMAGQGQRRRDARRHAPGRRRGDGVAGNPPAVL